MLLKIIKNKFWIICITLLVGASCETSKPYYNKTEQNWEANQPSTKPKLVQTLYLIGDVGAPASDPLEPSLALLERKLNASQQDQTTVVFLGDNLYYWGLHKKDHPDRAKDEKRLTTQMDILKDFNGRIVFLPGNHDWQQGRKKGDHFVKRQERFVEKYLNRGNTFLPDEGCPGPVEIALDDHLLLVVIDSQWWLHKHDKPKGDQDDCDVEDEATFIRALQDILKKNRNKQIIITAHHPIYSNGKHGGHFPIREHIFPLTSFNKKLYVPLPGLGSIYPAYRSLLGDIQDIPHHKYQVFVDFLTKAFNEYEDVVYVSGHEHNLQYQQHGTAHYVVSGAGCKTSYLRQNRQLTFGQATKGFSRLQYYDNGDLWLEFWAPDPSNPEGKILFRKQLRNGHRIDSTPKEALSTLDYSDSIATVVPGGKYYKAGPVKEVVFGSLYRDVWTTPINVPVIDLSKEHGGLTPIKKGGGMQSKSLRLQGADGMQYVLRSIQKFPAKVIPAEIRNTFAAKIVQDGIAASHPYASIIIPTLADAARVYHTNPTLVYVPRDPLLGEYTEEFGGMLCLYEERPDDDQSHMASFGHSKKVVSSPKMILKLREHYKHQVDDYAMLRARLFDLVIGDWDRHDDQWRWSSFKQGKKTIYRPIPRDRDQAFFHQDGIIPTIANRKWAVRKFQSFDEQIRDMRGMNFNGMYVDRAYLNELSAEDWQAVADTLQKALTDELFEEALQLFPKPVHHLQNERLLKILKAHRDNLKEFADEYYRILAEEVNVVGTYKKEYFEIKRLDDQQTEVTIYPLKKGKKVADEIIYHRIFKTDETKEINIYGLDGKDQYHISGEVNEGPLVRLIGGADTDSYIDKSIVKGLRRHNQIYDTKEKKEKNANQIVVGKEAKVLLAKREHQAVVYERKAFQYDFLGPMAYLGYNPDDGIYLGAGVHLKKFGFNKKPYKYSHRLKANYAVATGAYNFDYRYDQRSIWHSKWDFNLHFDVKAPDFLFNFYGLGNETERGDNLWRDYRLRLNLIEFNPTLVRRSEGGVHEFKIGPTLQFINPPDEDANDPLSVLPQFRPLLNFENRTYLGAKAGYYLKNQDNKNNPHRGIHFFVEGSWNKGINIDNLEFTRLKSELRLYFPLGLIPGKTTLALRTGGAVNQGNYHFYQGNFLGGYSELRGLRRNRFGGDATFYNNVDLRAKLFNIDNYVLPIEVGVLGFFDYGRVWLEGEDSDLWHQGYGGGVYVSPLNSVVITGNYGISDDDEVFSVIFGFLF